MMTMGAGHEPVSLKARFAAEMAQTPKAAGQHQSPDDGQRHWI
jgi:hypothetical protein